MGAQTLCHEQRLKQGEIRNMKMKKRNNFLFCGAVASVACLQKTNTPAMVNILWQGEARHRVGGFFSIRKIDVSGDDFPQASALKFV
jgi:hypothetical protein